VPVRT